MGNTLLRMYFYIYQFISLFTVAAQGIIVHPGQDVELICDVNGTVSDTLWRINGSSSLLSPSGLSNGAVAGHNASGRNIVVEDIIMNDIRNGSQYECVVLSIPITSGTVTTLYVAGECND